MEAHHWPLHGLRITTPRLELRLPDLPLLDELAAVAADGVHDPADMPFTFPWTDSTPADAGRATFQHVLRTIADWQPDRWCLSLAVLHLAFACLGAHSATSAAMTDNPAPSASPAASATAPTASRSPPYAAGPAPSNGSAWTARPGKRTARSRLRWRGWRGAGRCSGYDLTMEGARHQSIILGML
jgi:hypothetical protein